MVAPADPSAPGIVTTIQATTSNALEATGGYLASAQGALTSNVPQETKQGVAEALDDAKVNTIEAVTTAAATVKSASYEPSQTASNVQIAVQPHIDIAKQTAFNTITPATQPATTTNGASTQAQDTKAAVDQYATAARKTAEEYTTKAQETGAARAESIQQGTQPLMDKAKGVLNSQREPVTPVGLPAEGIEGVLKYGEDKSESAKQTPKDKAG
jgi:hypothetical protein